ncbi:hypothetical protein J4E70_18970 [Pseudohalocynthiibacter aestuariivivens]|uniref:DUF6639 family protein n=1 Tax=Pseudohalocynthiibacter aestuariivivens TaxID=1591409 RepID=UPI001BD24A31|nr:DUF6639 family protein [Pseudohalocynthiibacter aestuariivivens]MBS9719020.1 hypothetical protein [Pseudohalocynthiibacter aestuariivivens]
MWKLNRICAALAILSAGSPCVVSASPELIICQDDQLSVLSPTPEFVELACHFAIEAKTRLLECGLHQPNPIEIFLVERIEHDIGDCLATYDCTDEIIRVKQPESIADALVEGSPYSVLPTTVIFQALVSHEMAHALLEQSSRGTDLAFVDHEYVAAVMELDIIDPEWRQALIDAAPVRLPPKPGLISALIYGFEPRKFATNAWQYFNAEVDGCERIRQIADGNFSFTDQPR